MNSAASGPEDAPQPSTKVDASARAAAEKAALRAKSAAAKAAVKEKARLRDKVIAMLKKHAGDQARDIQRNKTVMELMISIEADSKAEVDEQINQKAALQAKVDHMEQTVYKDLEASQNEVCELKRKVQELELAMYNAAYAYDLAKAEHAQMQSSLRCAEEAAAVATAECGQLAAAVLALTEQDAKARRALAHRAHNLRVALSGTSARLREFNDLDRKARNEKEWKLLQREKALEAERQVLQDQQAAQAERDLVLETTQLRYFLAKQDIHALKQQVQQAQQQQAASNAAGAAPAGAAGATADAPAHGKGTGAGMKRKLLAGGKRGAARSSRQSQADGDFLIKAVHGMAAA